MGKITRIDMFSNIDEYIEFMEWAALRHPKTKADMIRLLHEYKQADLFIDAHPERVEHEIVKGFKTFTPRLKKGDA